MSKKSRRRNKKLLAMLALAGGAAMMGRRKGKSVVDTAANEDANIGTNYPILGTDHIKKVVAPVDTAPVITGVQEGNTRLKRDGVGPNESVIANRLTAGNRVPPSMRGGALHAEGYQSPGRNIKGRLGKARPIQSYNMYGLKKGGSVKKARVTGIAKRGFGRALMKGKK